MGDELLLLLLTAALVLLNGLFVAAEFAVVKVRVTRIDELVAQGSRLATVARGILTHLDSTLAACQVGITVASLALGAIAEPALARVITPILDLAGITGEAARHAVAWAVAISTISFIHVVIGEQAPKAAAIAYAEKTTLLLAVPIRIFHFLLYPAVWVTNAASNGVLKIFGLKNVNEGEAAYSPDELEKIIEVSNKAGLLNDAERRLLENAINLSERRVREIMVPRPDILSLDATRTLEENLAVVCEHQHTRYPLTTEDKDKVIGMVHVKDLTNALLRGERDAALIKLARPVAFVPALASLDRVLKTFQRSGTHLAIVVDEYGGVVGLVTLEDILEELVGEIRDEFDSDEMDSSVIRSGSDMLVEAGLPLGDVAKAFRFEPMEVQVETIGGYVLHLLGRLPKIGEAVQIGRYRVEVHEMEGLRLTRLKWRPLSVERGGPPAVKGEAAGTRSEGAGAGQGASGIRAGEGAGAGVGVSGERGASAGVGGGSVKAPGK